MLPQVACFIRDLVQSYLSATAMAVLSATGSEAEMATEMATKLRDGGRDLVAWPKNAADTMIWLRPKEAKEAAVASVLGTA